MPEVEAQIAGGDYERGRELFFGERLKCSTCHRIRGEGAIVGPDLSNLAHRDAATVLRDIQDPSVAINPDYVAYNVATRDGARDLAAAGADRQLTAPGRKELAAKYASEAVRWLGKARDAGYFRPA